MVVWKVAIGTACVTLGQPSKRQTEKFALIYPSTFLPVWGWWAASLSKRFHTVSKLGRKCRPFSETVSRWKFMRIAEP
jgi:hypothetical protein